MYNDDLSDGNLSNDPHDDDLPHTNHDQEIAAPGEWDEILHIDDPGVITEHLDFSVTTVYLAHGSTENAYKGGSSGHSGPKWL